MVSARRLARLPVQDTAPAVPASMERFEPSRWIDMDEVPPVWLRPEEMELRRYVRGWRRWQTARREWLAGRDRREQFMIH
jgi:hypothetical protein